MCFVKNRKQKQNKKYRKQKESRVCKKVHKSETIRSDGFNSEGSV